MKKPIVLAAARVHANAGDVVLTATDGDGVAREVLRVDGQATAFTVLREAAEVLTSLIACVGESVRVAKERSEAHEAASVKK